MSAISDEIRARRSKVITDLDRGAQPYELVSGLIELDKAALAAGESELSRELRSEIIAAGVHPKPAGLPEHPARFDFISDELRDPVALELLATRAADPTMPPLVRAHYLDLVWSLETGQRVHPLAGRDAADAYLDHDVAIGDDVPDVDADVVAWSRWSDALARSGELARETGQVDVAKRAAGAIRRRLRDADSSGAYRLVLEPGYGLLATAKLVPDALADIPDTLGRARKAFIAEKKYHFARWVIELEIDIAKTQRRAADIPGLRTQAAESFITEADERAASEGGSLVAGTFVQSAIEIYRKVPGSERRIADLTRRLERDNLAALGELKTVTAEVTVPTADMERYYAYFTGRPMREALGLVGYHFLLDREAEYARYDAAASRFVFTRLTSHTLLTEYGETISFSPGTPEFRDYGVFRQAAQGMQFADPFLDEVLRRLRANGLDPETVIDYLSECPFFVDDVRELVSDSVRRIFSGDDVGAAHVLVPQLEALIRSLVRQAGIPITQVRERGSEMILLGGLLSVLRRHGVLEDKFLFTLEVALTRLGWNIRNRVAHGLIKKSECTPAVSNRLFQLVLALGLLRSKDSAGG